MRLKTVGRVCIVLAALFVVVGVVSAFIACWVTGELQDNLGAQVLVSAVCATIFGCAGGCCNDLDQLG